jgi:hypothetical protein
MPKKPIDYTKTIFYRIVCNDINIKDCYVGHTTNFIKRKQHHKNNTNDENDNHYNIYVYKFIRDNGGWNNWSMIIIDNVKCDNLLDALRQERKFFEEYQATLNKQIPSRTRQEWKEDNKDNIKKWKEDNKDIIKEQRKNYRELNKDKIKEYRETNKDKIKEQRHQLIFCDCCKINIIRSNISTHYKTMKHIKNASTEVVI